MNYSGSYRKLTGNAKAAMLAAIEIYNKPQIPYRDEIVVILLVNAWELLAKAVISKSRKSIYYKKRRGEPHRTLTIDDAMRRAASSPRWPDKVDKEAVLANVRLLSTYRDNSVHFYNEEGFSALLYSLAQTAIINFRDTLSSISGSDIADEITWAILPLGADPPVDPIELLRRKGPTSRGRATDEFISALREEELELTRGGGDSGRLLTIYKVSLQSVKKIEHADLVAGIDPENENLSIIAKSVDPNKSHPWRQKDVLERLDMPFKFGPYEFQAATTQLGLRSDSKYCWVDKDINLVRWSPETLGRIRQLTQDDVKRLRSAYSLSKRKTISD